VPAALAEAARVLRPSGRVVAAHDKPDASSTDVTVALRSLAHRRDAGARADRVEAVDAAAAAAGLRPVHHGWTARYDRTQTPNDVADGLEQRIWSYLWTLDDEAWQREAGPAVAALRALPEPDQPRPYQIRHRV